MDGPTILDTEALLMIRAAMHEIGHGEWADTVRACPNVCNEDQPVCFTSKFRPTPDADEAFYRALNLVQGQFDIRKTP